MWKVVNHICPYFPLFAIISRYFPVNATGMANMLICRHFANLVENGKNQLLDSSNRYVFVHKFKIESKAIYNSSLNRFVIFVLQ